MGGDPCPRFASRPGAAARQAWVLFALVSGQALLGILTLVYVVPIDIALTHQFGATIVLISATIHAYDLHGGPERPISPLRECKRRDSSSA